MDIWGVGVMAYDVLVGQPPFNTDDPNTTVEAILLREAEYPDYLSDDAVDFIDQVGEGGGRGGGGRGLGSVACVYACV